MAQYMYKSYRNAQAKASSPEWRKWMRMKNAYEQELEHFKQARRAAEADAGTALSNHELRQIMRSIADTEKKVAIVRSKVPDKKAVSTALLQTIKAYGRFIRFGVCPSHPNPRHTDTSRERPVEGRLGNAVYRLVGLWLENDSDPAVSGAIADLAQPIKSEPADVTASLDSSGARVPAYLFVPLLRQLCSRLDTVDVRPSSSSGLPSPGSSTPTARFQQVLQNLVEDIGRTHVYHVLGVLYPLTKGQDVDNQHRGAHVLISMALFP